jgi:hypothetical protein
MKKPKYSAGRRLGNTDEIEGRLHIQVLNAAGDPLLQLDNPLKDYVWTGAGKLADGRHLVELYDRNSHAADVPRAQNLSLRFSYSGDQTLTNRGYLTLEVWPQ